MTKGDFIYHFTPEGGTMPATVKKVNRKTLTIEGDFIGGKNTRNVSINNCQLQSDWLKENSL